MSKQDASEKPIGGGMNAGSDRPSMKQPTPPPVVTHPPQVIDAIVINNEYAETAWAKEVQKQSSTDLYWIGAGLTVMGIFAAIAVVLIIGYGLFGHADEFFRDETGVWVCAIVGGGSVVFVTIGMALLLYRASSEAMVTALSAVFAVFISFAIGTAMVVLILVALAILLFVACLQALGGGFH